MNKKSTVLSCGHPIKYSYFHPAAGYSRYRCIACDDPKGNSRFMQENPLRIEYVVGFLYNENRTHVVLIEKKRPKWQRGKLNSVGGHIENGETIFESMEREFKEETGLEINNWELGIVISGKTWTVYFFSACGPIYDVSSMTDEKVSVRTISYLPKNTIPNLQWLIPLCLDQNIEKPIYLYDHTESLEDNQ